MAGYSLLGRWKGIGLHLVCEYQMFDNDWITRKGSLSVPASVYEDFAVEPPAEAPPAEPLSLEPPDEEAF